MNEAEFSFRTTIGGFNRQDVLNYIESMAKGQSEKAAALQKQTEEAQRAREAAETAAHEAETVMQRLIQENERLNTAMKEQAAQLEASQSALTEERETEFNTREELAAAQLELESMQARISKVEAEAIAYEQLKDRTATIELEARQRARNIEKAAEERAQTIEQEAAERAQAVRDTAERLLSRIQSGYERLRGDVDATIAHASGELGRVDRALDQVKVEFAEHDAELGRLLKLYQDGEAPQVPEPLPMEEK